MSIIYSTDDALVANGMTKRFSLISNIRRLIMINLIVLVARGRLQRNHVVLCITGGALIVFGRSVLFICGWGVIRSRKPHAR